VNSPEAVALDSAGNLYVANSLGRTVTVYSSPFSASSVPSTTLTVSPGPFNDLVSIAIGNSTAIPAAIPAIGLPCLTALCAVLLVIGFVAIRAKT
jgi:hypothetical protein